MARLGAALGLGIRGCLDVDLCARWTAATLAARPAWTSDFGGEQFCLGRAFYTHLETGQTRLYFADAEASNARVEALLPGMQARLRALVARVTGAIAVQRRGWCGAGVHVFPPGEEVAREGGVIHGDVEGLSAHHVERELPALTLVAMLQAPQRGGGLRLYDARTDRCAAFDVGEIDGASRHARLRPGDLVVFDSYRLHRIQPFSGERARLSVTLHAAESAPGRWETWF